MLTVTALVSVAVPVNDGVATLDRGFGWGLRVTVGAAVSSLSVTGALVPSGLPNSELFCDAIAVYVCAPAGSGVFSGLEVHDSPAGVAVASETIAPVGRSPS